MTEMKDMDKSEVIAMLNSLTNWHKETVLEWANETFELDAGDLQMSGADDWWVENQELRYINE